MSRRSAWQIPIPYKFRKKRAPFATLLRINISVNYDIVLHLRTQTLLGELMVSWRELDISVWVGNC